MTTPDYLRFRPRLMPLKNESAEEMPGYGLGCLTPTEPFSSEFSLYSKIQARSGGDHGVWRVERPGESSSTNLIEYLQDPGMLVANASPVPIPPGGYGMGTQDWPIRVLHDPSDGRLGNGAICGPSIGTWYVSSAGDAFTCVSHDPTEIGSGLGGAGEPASLHRIFVTRARHSSLDKISMQGGNTGIVANGTVPFSVISTTGLINPAYVNNDAAFTMVSSGLLRCDKAGVYHFGMTAFITAAAALGVGASLNVTLMHNLTGGTGFDARAELIVVPTDVAIGQNISCTGIINLAVSDTLHWQNLGGGTADITSATWWIARHSAYQAPIA